MASTLADVVTFSNASTMLDHFPVLFESRPAKIFCTSFAFVLSVVDIVMLAGIIWYERAGFESSKRTLVNKLVSSACLSFIAVLVVCLTDVVRYFSGPFPSSLCLAQVWLT